MNPARPRPLPCHRAIVPRFAGALFLLILCAPAFAADFTAAITRAGLTAAEYGGVLHIRNVREYPHARFSVGAQKQEDADRVYWIALTRMYTKHYDSSRLSFAVGPQYYMGPQHERNGSRLNAYLGLVYETDLGVVVEFYHFSNGQVTDHNPGLNAVSLGVRF